MTAFRTIWPTEDKFVEVIDQRKLPHEFVIVKLKTYKDAEIAIKEMTVRGAPLIGATAAYGIYLAVREMIENELKRINTCFFRIRSCATEIFTCMPKC